MDASARLLFFHKQKTSARTRFLRFPHGMLGFSGLPVGSVLRAGDAPAPALLLHPAPLLKDAAARMGLSETALRAETEFSAVVDTPNGTTSIVLVECTSIDPPFAQAEAVGGRFIAITEARDCDEIELALLRCAYEVLIG